MYEFPERYAMITLTLKCNWCHKGVIRYDYPSTEENPLIDAKCPACGHEMITYLDRLDPDLILNRIVRSI